MRDKKRFPKITSKKIASFSLGFRLKSQQQNQSTGFNTARVVEAPGAFSDPGKPYSAS
jgi:hypothetical protein